MSPSLRVLVVDDDRIVRTATAKQLEDAGYTVEVCESAQRALERLSDGCWDVVLSDLRMPGMDGLGLLEEIGEHHAGVETILMTAFGAVETAVRAMQAGASDYLVKPFHFDELEVRLRKLEEQRRTAAELEALRELIGTTQEMFGLMGRTQGIHAVRDRIRTFADHSAPVLILGETGTGKEVVARALHHAGKRSDGEFVAVGCGVIPRDLAESELFGHERGSFTGATQQRRGSFERASGGTLLLDDVDDLPLELQVKLLRVLQDGTFTRVGGAQELTTDARVIATTKSDLEHAVEDGEFRADLYYRLRGLEITLPPLRQRGDDVLLLANHFLALTSSEEGGAAKTLSPEVAKVLMGYGWPGNVRELRRAVETMQVLCTGWEVGLEHMPDFLSRTEQSGQYFELSLGQHLSVPFNELLREFEARVFDWALTSAAGNQTEAARLLGIPRTTLQSRLSALRSAAPEPPDVGA